MPVPTDPYTFSDGPGNTASGVQVNQRFNPLYAALNPAVTGLDYQNVQNNGLRELNMATGPNGLAKGTFSAYRSTAVGAASSAVILFDTEEDDISGWYDPVTGRFTPLVAGWYRFSWSVTTTSSPTVDSWLQAVLRKNSVAHKNGQVHNWRTASAGWQSSGSARAQANGTTDFFDIFANNNWGTIMLAAGAALTYFQGELIGRS